MDEQFRYPTYVLHKGTLLIAGSTIPKSAAACAFRHLKAGIAPIEFFYIGGNAGQQATKAMTVFAGLVRKDSADQINVSFTPTVVMTDTPEVGTNTTTQKFATVWRTIIYDMRG